MILIFSGYNQRAVIAFLRTLEENKIDNYNIVAASDRDTILKTNYKKKVLCIRKNEELDLGELCNILDQLNGFKLNEKILIAPSTEALNRFVLKHRKMLEEHNAVIPLVNEDLYIEVSDKNRFWKLCKEYDLLVPGQTENVTEYRSPIVAKPKEYISTNGMIYSPFIIQSKQQFEYFREKYPVQEFTYQELIDGESYYLLYYITQSGQINCLSQRNLAQQPNGKSIIAACLSTLHRNNGIAKQYAEMFKNIGFWGFIMVELRKRGNAFYMIEANPRFWGPSQLFCNSGYNFFEFFLQEYGYIDHIIEREINFQAKYLWTGGIVGKLLIDDNCSWLEGGRKLIRDNIGEYLKCDIYRRPDTIEIYNLEDSMK